MLPPLRSAGGAEKLGEFPQGAHPTPISGCGSFPESSGHQIWCKNRRILSSIVSNRAPAYVNWLLPDRESPAGDSLSKFFLAD